MTLAKGSFPYGSCLSFFVAKISDISWTRTIGEGSMVSFILYLVMGIAMANPNIEVQGHRGARAMRPENTLAAFKYALENNVQTLEMDLSYTKDGKLVVNHDPGMNATVCLDPNGQKITKNILVQDLTLKEFQKYDCGTLKNPKFEKQQPSPKEKMPTFEEVLALVKSFDKATGAKAKMNVEIKVHNDYITKNLSKIVKETIAELKKYNLYNRANLQSFDISAIEEIRKQDKKIPLSFLVGEKMENILKNLKLKSSKEFVAKYKINILSPDFNTITKEQVKEFQDLGVRVIPWTVNGEKDWKAVITMGVDGIITDDPVGLKLYMNPQVTSVAH